MTFFTKLAFGTWSRFGSILEANKAQKTLSKSINIPLKRRLEKNNLVDRFWQHFWRHLGYMLMANLWASWGIRWPRERSRSRPRCVPEGLRRPGAAKIAQKLDLDAILAPKMVPSWGPRPPQERPRRLPRDVPEGLLRSGPARQRQRDRQKKRKTNTTTYICFPFSLCQVWVVMGAYVRQKGV